MSAWPGCGLFSTAHILIFILGEFYQLTFSSFIDIYIAVSEGEFSSQKIKIKETT